MQWTGVIGLALGMVMASAKLGPPPVMLDLGPVMPTPAPTPRAAEKKRLITVITVQNAPTGESVISFEATDVADEGKGKMRVLAAKTYSLVERKPQAKRVAARIMQQVRELEREMLTFVEIEGPPKQRAPLGAAGSQPAGR